MSKPHTIKDEYYVGRTFTPQQMEDVSSFDNPPPVQTKLGPEGVCCVKFRTGPSCQTVSVSCAPYPSGGPQDLIVSINENPADFSYGAGKNTGGSKQGKVGVTGRDADVYVPLENDKDYYVNVARKAWTGSGEFRVQVSTSP